MSIIKRVVVFFFWEYGLILNNFEDEKIIIFLFCRLINYLNSEIVFLRIIKCFWIKLY